jgi:hypothetical protein
MCCQLGRAGAPCSGFGAGAGAVPAALPAWSVGLATARCGSSGGVECAGGTEDARRDGRGGGPRRTVGALSAGCSPATRCGALAACTPDARARSARPTPAGSARTACVGAGFGRAGSALCAAAAALGREAAADCSSALCAGAALGRTGSALCAAAAALGAGSALRAADSACTGCAGVALGRAAAAGCCTARCAGPALCAGAAFGRAGSTLCAGVAVGREAAAGCCSALHAVGVALDRAAPTVVCSARCVAGASAGGAALAAVWSALGCAGDPGWGGRALGGGFDAATPAGKLPRAGGPDVTGRAPFAIITRSASGPTVAPAGRASPLPAAGAAFTPRSVAERRRGSRSSTASSSAAESGGGSLPSAASADSDLGARPSAAADSSSLETGILSAPSWLPTRMPCDPSFERTAPLTAAQRRAQPQLFPAIHPPKEVSRGTTSVVRYNTPATVRPAAHSARAYFRARAAPQAAGSVK